MCQKYKLWILNILTMSATVNGTASKVSVIVNSTINTVSATVNGTIINQEELYLFYITYQSIKTKFLSTS